MQDSHASKKIVGLVAQSHLLQYEDRYEEALTYLDEAINIDPHLFPLLIDKGTILDKLGRYEEAADCFDRILKFIPNSPDVSRLRSDTLHNALVNYEQTLNKDRGNSEIFVKRGLILERLYRYQDAVHSYDQALRIYPQDKDALINRGNALLKLNRQEDALKSYDRALETAPNDGIALYNRGNALQQLNRMNEALDSYGRALVRKPDLPEAVMEQGLCRLAMGDFEPGWRQFESRWETEQLKGCGLDSPQPLWHGEESLAGRTIVLWAEQGFGDTIQFLRYVPLAAKRAGHVILRVPASLQTLCETLHGPISVITERQPLPAHDCHCPLMSLPLAFGTTLDSIPADIPYVSANANRVKEWKDRLGPAAKPRIGLVWAGRRYAPLNRTRDMTLEDLRPLTHLDVEIISLQRELSEEDGRILESMPQVRCLGEALQDFADTASLIENLDMIITVDTAVAHLAGALGKPVWVMIRHFGEWRWLLERSDSPWYPSARLFRQKVRGDWTGVVSDVTEKLKILFRLE